MQQFLRDLITGLASGGIFALIAASLVLTYATTGIFNLGFAGVTFSAAYVFYELYVGLHWPQWAAACLVVFLLCPLLGLAMDRLVFGRMRQASDTAKIVASVGILLALPALSTFVVARGVNWFHWHIPLGTDVLLAPGIGPQPAHIYHVGLGVTISTDQIIAFAVALLVAVLLYLFLRRTETGLHMRAVVDRQDLAEMRGVNGNRMSSIAWIMSAMLAGIAGVVGAPILRSLDPNTYTLALFIAIAAAIVGRFRSIPLAFIGAIAVAVASNLVFTYATFAQTVVGFNQSVPFVLLLAGLIVMGAERSRVAGTITADAPPPDYSSDLPRWRRLWPWTVASVLGVVWLFFVLSDDWVSLFTRGLAFSLIFLSITIVTGIGGMVSLAQSAFAAAGALFAGALIGHAGAPYLVALLAGVAVAAMLGALIALPSVRLGSVPLALATLALAFVCSDVIFPLNWLGNGNIGWTINRPKIGPLDLSSDKTMAAVLCVLIALVVLMIKNLERSMTGRKTLAVRNAPSAAASIGISPAGVKVKLFVISAAVAGLGGILLVTYDQSATSSSFSTLDGLFWLAGVVLLGVRRPAGAIITGLAVVVFPQLISGGFTLPFGLGSWSGSTAPEVLAALFGLGAIGLAQQPDGAFQDWAARNFRRRQRRAANRSAKSAPVLLEVREPVGQPLPAPRASGDVAKPLNSASMLHIEGLAVAYEKVEALHDVDLRVEKGTIVALLGPNGAGKSTTCKAIAGTLPASRGSIRLNGEDVTSLTGWQRARRGLVLTPEGRGIFPSLTVQENIRISLAGTSFGSAAIFEWYGQLASRRDTPAGSLSGGEQQMLTLAPYLFKPFELLVVDEPALGLAPMIVDELMSLFAQLRSGGSTILLVGESPHGVLDIADAVALIHGGRIGWTGTPASLDSTALEHAYLGATPEVADPLAQGAAS